MKVRILTATIAAVMLAGPALIAQHRAGGGGYGHMVNPRGTAGPLVFAGGAPMVPRTGALGGAAYIAPPFVTHPANHGGAIIVPYPVFYGGGYYGYDAAPAPYAGGYYNDPYGGRQDAPAVIINQGFVPDTASPAFQDYSNTQLPPPTLRRYDNSTEPYPDPGQQQQPQAAAQNDQPSLYLIAMKDHTIYAAIGYWTEDQTLHYITPENVHNRVTLDQVDHAFTKQLNDERHIDMRLPAEQ